MCCLNMTLMSGSLLMAHGLLSDLGKLFHGLVPQFPLMKSGEKNSLHLTGLLRIKCNNMSNCLEYNLRGVFNFSFSRMINFNSKLLIRIGRTWREND